MGILRCLGFQGFLNWPHGPADLKPSRISKRLGLSVDAVRERIARLEASGVIAGYEYTPNLRVIAHDVTSYHFRLPDNARRNAALTEASKVDGVTNVLGFLSHDACIDIAHSSPDQLSRRVQVVARLMGDASPYAWYEFPLPPVDRNLSALDWRILHQLRRKGRAPFEELAESVGVTAKTFKRRHDVMAKAGVFDVTAILNPGAVAGQVLFLLFLQLRPGVSEREVQSILQAYHQRWFFSGSPPGAPQRSLYFALLARSMSDVDSLAREAESISGVVRAEPLIPVHMESTLNWVDEEIERRANPEQRATPSAVRRVARRVRTR